VARKLSKREILLVAGLGGAAVLYFWYSSRSPSLTAVAEAAAAAKAQSAEKAPKVRMDLLAQKVEGYNSEKRDLFKFSVRPPTAEELRLQREEDERRRKLIEQEAQQRAAAAAAAALVAQQQQKTLIEHPPPPQPPPITLKYIGYVGPKDDKVASFLDGDEVLVGKKGETVKGQYTIVEIKVESVVMGFTNPAFRNDRRELTLAPVSR
jgi:hypothetical protein